MCLPPFCGDGRIAGGEQCEPSRGARPVCSLSADQVFCALDCSWKMVELCEEQRPFDLNQFVPGAPVCGDALRQVGEECDDGNTRAGDGCSESCFMEFGRCGDNVVQSLLGEQCERGAATTGSVPCRADCRYLLLTCGNGTVEPGESCDLGTANSMLPNALCRADCSTARCGDRITDSGEECDDGNRFSFDGCTSTCRSERGAPTGVLPAVIIDLPLFIDPESLAIPCNIPADCPAGSMCSRGMCVTTPGSRPPVEDTGPAAVVLLGVAGAAAGWAWVRRRQSMDGSGEGSP